MVGKTSHCIERGTRRRAIAFVLKQRRTMTEVGLSVKVMADIVAVVALDAPTRHGVHGAAQRPATTL